MKIALRISTLLVFVAFCGGISLQPVMAQMPDPNHDKLFAAAKAKEATKPEDALKEYAEVKNEYSRKDPEIAAEALLRAGLFASDPKQFGTPEQIKAMTGVDATKEKLDEWSEKGDTNAHDSLKQLLQLYPTSKAAKFAQESKIQNGVENRLDKRHEALISYKLVDGLVGLTGHNPSFSYWFALLLIAVIVKGLTFPLNLKMYKSQREMQHIQPLVKELQAKYKGPEFQEKMMALYKEHNVSPFASCLPMLVQMPFLFWVFYAIRMYEFHFKQGAFLWIGGPLSHQFPGSIAGNLGEFDLILLTLYAVSNFLSMRLTPSTDPQAAQQQKTMSVMFTGMMFWMCFQSRWTAAFIFYWLVTNIIGSFQQYYYIYRPNKMKAAADGILLPAEKNPSGGRAASGNPIVSTTTLTPVPGGDALRPRPRRKPKK